MEICELKALLGDKDCEIELLRKRLRAAEEEAIGVRRAGFKDESLSLEIKAQIGYLREKYEEEIEALKGDLEFKDKVRVCLILSC